MDDNNGNKWNLLRATSERRYANAFRSDVAGYRARSKSFVLLRPLRISVTARLHYYYSIFCLFSFSASHLATVPRTFHFPFSTGPRLAYAIRFQTTSAPNITVTDDIDILRYGGRGKGGVPPNQRSALRYFSPCTEIHGISMTCFV